MSSRHGSHSRPSPTGDLITGARDSDVWLTYLRFGAEPEVELPAAFLTRRSGELVTEIQVQI